ncbi:FMN-dependent dehydrogenase-like protein 4 [Elsinoe australis]|uniref:FMN-dependent dehydrogenase-like protein 4 n=1 Tax=Elsinoe australis TaxID=40998 RepID=A0A4U7ALI2_9PEZI|nr:FMN-dependent dehydrogenase-like protein 4 [Elsinoe australis]
MNAFQDTTHPKQDGESKQHEVKKWGAFQNEIYAKGMFHGVMPTVTTDPNKLEAQAKEKMGKHSYNYVAGGAGERATMDANRLAFRTWKIIPRMLCDSSARDLTTTILGTSYPTPIAFSPIGVQSIFHPCAETGIAKIAAELGLPYTLSTASSKTIEEVAEASGEGSPRWFQLYWPQTDEITLSLMDRAKKAGYTVLIATLDTWSLAWRPWDLDEAYVPFMTGTGNQIGFSDPVFQRIYKSQTGKEINDDIVSASLAWQRDVFSGKTHSWDQVKLLVDNWDGPVVLKGIQHPDDARRAAQTGVKGIIVSNHGGRQMDGAVSSLEMLGECVEAVEGTGVEVLFDSGIRTGVDVIKALCLGAKGVLVGRPWVYGMGIAGEKGAKQVMQGLLADLDQSMGLAGMSCIKDMNKGWLRRSAYPGDRHSCN